MNEWHPVAMAVHVGGLVNPQHGFVRRCYYKPTSLIHSFTHSLTYEITGEHSNRAADVACHSFGGTLLQSLIGLLSVVD